MRRVQDRFRVGAFVRSRITLPREVRYPSIRPVAPGVERPFWSVMIPTYNRTRYLEETLRSVLDQDPGSGRMQIQVVDNGSTTGDAEALVRSVGAGRVEFFRQPRNLGLHANWNSCIERAHGRWVHLLHDDDAVLPGFYERYEQLIRRHPEATLVTSPSVFIDEEGRRLGEDAPLVEREGVIESFARTLATQNPLKTPSVVIARSAYERAGGFSDLLSHTADWEMFFRAGLAGAAVSGVEPLTLYRFHAKSDTSRLVRDGHNIEELLKAVELCFGRLPPEVQAELAPRKYVWAAAVAYGCSLQLAREGLWDGSLIQATWALRLAPRTRFVASWLRAVAQAMLHRARMAAPGSPPMHRSEG